MYEGDTPNAERRAAALSLDRDLLRELLGQDELRELIDPDALQTVADDLQHRSERMRAATRDELADVLRRLGDLTVAEAAERIHEPASAQAWLSGLADERRAVRLRIGGEERWVAADDAGLYRDALGAVPPGGLPEAFLADVPDALRARRARYARTHVPFTTEELRDRYRVDMSAVLAALEADGDLVRGELRPGGSGEREWCDPDVLRRLRRASLAALRKEIEPADQRALAAFAPSWQGVDRHAGGGRRRDRLREVLVPLQGLALPADVWERDVLPRRTGAYSPTWLDELCASGEVVWVGAGALGRSSGKVALYFREDAEAIGPPAVGTIRDRCTGRARARPAARASRPLAVLLHRPAGRGRLAPEDLQEALWDLVWAGEVTNDAWAPLRAPRLTLARAQRATLERRGRGTRRFGAPARQHAADDAGTLVADVVDLPLRGRPARRSGAPSPSCFSSATASSPARPSWPRASPAASRRSTTRSPTSRPSASADAATSSRAWAARSSRSPAPSSGCGRAATTRARPPLVLAATDPAQAYGAALRGPSATASTGGRPASPAPTSSSSAPSRRSTSSAAGAA